MLLDEVGAYLEGQNVALKGQNLFLGTRPEDPDEILYVLEYPGMPPEYQNDGQSTGPVREQPQLQVTVRGRDYESARRLIQNAWLALNRVTNVTLSGKFYQSIRATSSPALIGRDQSDRVLLSFNASVLKEV